MQIGGLNISFGFLVDNLTSVMLVVVSFVSLMVHIYTIGYMHEDEGYTNSLAIFPSLPLPCLHW